MSECNLNSPVPSIQVLKEFELKSDIAKLIPAQAQKGLSTFNVDFTCLDVANEYIAIGSNVGILYLYDRKRGKLLKLRNENYKDPISCVKLIISLECLVAFGCQSGLVLAFKVPFGSDLEVEKFTVQDIHNSPVSAIEWAKNGLKFFTGDKQGNVVCTEIDHMEHQSRSRILMEENSEIVQLSYSRLNLLISTLCRSFLYRLSNSQFVQIGQKERKCPDRFGAVFRDQNGTNLFASRQGQRLWKSDVTGVIQETILFKSALAQSHPSIKLLAPESSNFNLASFQFGPLQVFDDKYIILWSEAALVLVDPEHQSVIASCCSLYPIVDVTTCNDEIFVIHGQRHLIRIAFEPEIFLPNIGLEESSVIDDLLEPFKDLRSAIKERSETLSVQSSTPSLFGWLKRNRSTSVPSSLGDQIKTPNEVKVNVKALEPLPSIIKLDSKDYTPVQIPSSLTTGISKEIKVNDSSGQNDDIVFKPRKKNKKNKKVRFTEKNTEEKLSSSVDSQSNSLSKLEKHDNSSNVEQKVPDNANHNSDVMNNNNDVIDIGVSAIITDSVESNQLLTNLEDNSNTVKANFKTETDKNIENTLCNLNNDVHEKVPVNAADLKESNKSITNLNNYSDNSDQTCDNLIYSCSTDATEKTDNEISENLILNKNEESSEASERSSNEDYSLASLEANESHPPKYGLNWAEYDSKEVLCHLSISNEHIFWVDANNRLHLSDFPVLGLKSRELQQPAEKVSVSPKETIVWVLFKGTIYAAYQKSAKFWEDTEWISIARDIIAMSVDEDCGWYISSAGKLLTQQKLSVSKPFGYPDGIHCPLSIDQVACRDGVVWVRTTSHLLYYREKGNKDLNSDSKWQEIKYRGIQSISNIYLGTGQTAWIVDHDDCIWFLIGVTSSTPEGIGNPWQLESSTYFQQSSMNLTKSMLKSLNNELMGGFLRSRQQICLSASEMGVWFCKTLDNQLYCNQNAVIGHSWHPVIPVGTAAATKWTMLSAKGVHKSEGGIWCLTSTGELVCLCSSMHTPFTVDLPCAEQQVKWVESMPNHLWLLTENGSIFVRRGITSKCVHGVWWQQLDLSQLDEIHLCHISCSLEIVWACDMNGNVFARIGQLNPSDASPLSQAWMTIDSKLETSSSFLDKLSSIGKKFPLPIVQPSLHESVIHKVYVGIQSFMVWALDDRGCVYFREGITYKLPIGEKWTLIPDLCAKELCISASAVWMVHTSGKIYRRFGISEHNPGGDYWKWIPGMLDSLSGAVDDDLWGLHDNKIFCHTSYVLNSSTQERKHILKTRSISEEDWEDIMTDSS